MRFWCSQLFQPWTWTPQPYIGVWLILAMLIINRRRAIHRARTNGLPAPTTRQRWWFWLGLFAFWAASDWPIGTLGAGYLASVHMLQYMIYTLAAAPLLLISMPDWRMRQLIAGWHLGSTVRVVSRPLIAAIIANVILIATHAPLTVDSLRTSQIGSFLLDIVWFVGGVLLWLPVLNPIKDQRIRSVPVRMIYLFMAAQLTPMIPGGFLTFANYPLYSTYELAPRVGLDALTDQQLAGAIMKVGSLPVIWIVIAVLWARWAAADSATDGSYKSSAASRQAPPTHSPAPASHDAGSAATG